MSKLTRARKLRAPGCLYVSVRLDEDTKDHSVWLKKFYGRLELEVRAAPDRFEDLSRTNLIAGDVGNSGTVISAVVSVITDSYLLENVDRGKVPAHGELARFIDRTIAASGALRDDEIAVEIFLAPLEEPTWTWKIRGIRLDDPRLTRLRETRFVLPTENEGEAKRQIDAAAKRVVIDSDEGEELEAP